jgi:DUF1680 family protein
MACKNFWWLGLVGGLSLAGMAVAAEPPPQPIPVRQAEINDSFWSPRLQAMRERAIPHGWQYMQWELRALRKAGGQTVTGDLNGTWGEANLHKFLETVAYSLAQHPDPELERQVDGIVDLLKAAQQPDGYLHAYITNNRKPQWDPAFLDGSHDGYVLGHMIEAAIEYHAATGKRAFLDIACRAADQACNHFLGPKGKPGFCGHAELEMALVELHRVTGQARYLELARAFVEWRGRGKVTPAGPTPRAYFQDAEPVRQQRTLEGHAVRALFFATGVADLALVTGEADYRLAANRFWDSTTLRRMTITGSVGPRKEHEAFGEDYELPNNGYYESCAACGLADFALRMFCLERTARNADVLERVLYNAVLHGMALSGTNSYYQNPLTDRNNARYNSWVCCPPNLSRTILQAGRYAVATTARELYVNLFIGGRYECQIGKTTVTLAVATRYPWEGRIQFTVQTKQPATFALNLRRPEWCGAGEVRVNGQPVDSSTLTDSGYWSLPRQWRDGDQVELNLPMPVERWAAHPNAGDCRGKVAVQRGPLVYAFEGLDNAGRPAPTLGADPAFGVEHRPDLLGGITVIKGVAADGQPFVAIPFYALANRQKSTQEVWVNQSGMTPDDRWWEGNLYRRWQLGK